MARRRLSAVAGALFAVLVAGCSTTTPPVPSTPPVATTPALATTPPAATSPATASATRSPQLPAELVLPGTLKICTPFGRARFAELDAQGQPFGVDVEIGNALAAELALQPELIDTHFDDLIAAVTGGQCDVSIGGQFITADRLARIAMIPYRQGAPNVIVAAGNPLGIEDLADLCGRRFAVVTGTVYVDMVRGAGDFAGSGIDEQCAAASLPAVELQEHPSQDAAEDALADGAADAYAGNDFVTVERPSEFELSFELPPLRNGIGLRPGATELDAALRAALRTMISDGTYLDILGRYGAQDNRITETP